VYTFQISEFGHPLAPFPFSLLTHKDKNFAKKKFTKFE
jgi:hypothetical protein